MKLRHLEQAALAGLDGLDPAALQSPLGNPRWPDRCYTDALGAAQSHYPDTSQVDSELLNGLYRDSRWLVAAYARSLQAHDGDLVAVVNHQEAIGRSTREMLRLGAVDDNYRAEFAHQSEVAEKAGEPPFVLIGDEDNLLAQWNRLQNRLLLDAPEARGCPALRVPSSLDSSETIAGHFLSRYTEVFGIRTIAQSTQVSLGSIAVCTT